MRSSRILVVTLASLLTLVGCAAGPSAPPATGGGQVAPSTPATTDPGGDNGHGESESVPLAERLFFYPPEVSAQLAYTGSVAGGVELSVEVETMGVVTEDGAVRVTAQETTTMTIDGQELEPGVETVEFVAREDGTLLIPLNRIAFEAQVGDYLEIPSITRLEAGAFTDTVVYTLQEGADAGIQFTVDYSVHGDGWKDECYAVVFDLQSTSSDDPSAFFGATFTWCFVPGFGLVEEQMENTLGSTGTLTLVSGR